MTQKGLGRPQGWRQTAPGCEVVSRPLLNESALRLACIEPLVTPSRFLLKSEKSRMGSEKRGTNSAGVDSVLGLR